MKWLIQYGSVIGAVALGLLTALVDYHLPPHGTMRGTWEADFPLAVAVAVSIFVGAVLGGAFADALDLQQQGMHEDAAFAALRWGLAAAVLFGIGPLGDFDNTLREPSATYGNLLRSSAPGILATITLICYALFLKHRLDKDVLVADSSEQK